MTSSRRARLKASLPPDPGILGFHPENVRRTEHHHNEGFKKGTTFADATFVAHLWN
jgi:hypothetical protein